MRDWSGLIWGHEGNDPYFGPSIVGHAPSGSLPKRDEFKDIKSNIFINERDNSERKSMKLPCLDLVHFPEQSSDVHW